MGANESTSHLLPDLILAFREHQHPDVKVEIYRHVSSRLPREVLRAGMLISRRWPQEPADRDLEAFPVLKDELCSHHESPSTHSRDRSSVKVKDLGRE